MRRQHFQIAGWSVLMFWVLTVLYLVLSDEEDTPASSNKLVRINRFLGSKESKLKSLLRANGPFHGHRTLPSYRDAIHVCLTSDENTVMGMIATINSIHKNTRHPIIFHLVLPSSLVHHVSQWIQNTELQDIQCEIKVFDPSQVEGKVKVRGGRQELAQPMNYARFYYDSMFPDLEGKIIHIDDDCIVQGDIRELYNTELGSNHIAAFSEDCSSVSKRFTLFQNVYVNFLNFRNPRVQALHLNPRACSFNTGVYVARLDRWRATNVTQKLEYWTWLNTKQNIYGNEKGGGGSQPPMMIVLYKQYALIDPMWHVRHLGWTAGRRYSRAFIQHAKLLHWNGRYKPWNGAAQYADIWDKYYIPDPSRRFQPIRKSP